MTDKEQIKKLLEIGKVRVSLMGENDQIFNSKMLYMLENLLNKMEEEENK